MAPKRPVRAAVGSVVRTTRRVVQETVEVSVVQEKDVAAGEKKVVEVEVQETVAEQPPQVPPAVKGEEVVAAPQPTTPEEEKQPPAAGEEEEESEEETQPPLESEELERGVEEKPQQVAEEGRRGEEADGGLQGEKPAGKVEGKEGEGEEKGKKKRGRRRRKRMAGGAAGGAAGKRGYKRYVFRVLKQVHPELRVSSMAMTVLDSLMNDMFERIVDEASKLSKYSGKATLSSREIQGAVRLVLPGELGKHAVAEGAKAVANYMAAEKAGA